VKDEQEAISVPTLRGALRLVDIGEGTPGPALPPVGPAEQQGASPAGGAELERFSVVLVDAGPQPLDVLGVFAQLGCPPDLASDYVSASVAGGRPEVLKGASAADADRLAVALLTVGADVLVEPSDSGDQGAGVEPSPGQPGGPSSRLTAGARPPAGVEVAPVEVVERYLSAYNEGDERRLVGCLSASAVLSDASGRVLVQGAEAIGRRMVDIFRYYPERKVAVQSRVVAGTWVLEHHNTTFGAGSHEETVMCFRVDNGTIGRIVLLTMT
jgi:hypothetical protein